LARRPAEITTACPAVIEFEFVLRGSDEGTVGWSGSREPQRPA
jgi:hypothetical protein